MKTLVNKANPQIRITVPEVEVFKCFLILPFGNFDNGIHTILDGDFWTLVEQNPAEWSEEDEEKRDDIVKIIEYSTTIPAYGKTGILKLSKEYKKELTDWLKSLHPQSKDEIYKEKNEAFKLGKHQLAIKFMNYLDENRPEGKMSLSNGECEDIDKAFQENDWAKIMRYAKKYQIQQEQKPEVKLKGWVARDRDEEIWVYRNYPKKDFETQEWMGSGSIGTMRLDQKSFPDLKWEDAPVEVEITIKGGSK